MEQKKKIIAFIDWYAPGYKAGGGQRAFANFVAYMKEYYDFYIITRNTDFMESTPYQNIQSDVWVNRSEGEFVYYAAEINIGNRLFKGLLNDVNPDFAYVNGIYSYKFSILPLITLRLVSFKGRILQGTYGMLAASAINVKATKKKIFLQLAKMIRLHKNVVFHATSDGELDDISRVFGNEVKTILAPHFPDKNVPTLRTIVKNSGELRLVSVARISPEKNTLFALQCLKELGAIEGNVVFDIYGPIYDQPYWLTCQQVVSELPVNIKVNYLGVLNGSEAMTKMMDYHCLFMPSRGENFGYVILESFMAGRPVLISNCTPWRDLEQSKAGFDLPLDDINRFCVVLNQLVAFDQQVFNYWSNGAEKRALDFINDPELLAVNQMLFKG